MKRLQSATPRNTTNWKRPVTLAERLRATSACSRKIIGRSFRFYSAGPARPSAARLLKSIWSWRVAVR